MVYISGSSYKAATSGTRNLPLVILNSCVLVAGGILLAVSAYLFRKDRI